MFNTVEPSNLTPMLKKKMALLRNWRLSDVDKVKKAFKKMTYLQNKHHNWVPLYIFSNQWSRYLNITFNFFFLLISSLDAFRQTTIKTILNTHSIQKQSIAIFLIMELQGWHNYFLEQANYTGSQILGLVLVINFC